MEIRWTDEDEGLYEAICEMYDPDTSVEFRMARADTGSSRIPLSDDEWDYLAEVARRGIRYEARLGILARAFVDHVIGEHEIKANSEERAAELVAEIHRELHEGTWKTRFFELDERRRAIHERLDAAQSDRLSDFEIDLPQRAGKFASGIRSAEVSELFDIRGEYREKVAARKQSA